MNEHLRLTVARLTRMRDKLRQHGHSSLVATKARGAPSTSADDDAFWTEMRLAERELRRMLHGLASDLSALESELALTWRIPRELRYSARQSVKDRRQNVLDVVELAELVLRELLELGGNATRLRPDDWLAIGEEASKLVDQAGKSMVKTTIEQVQKGPAFTAATGLPGLAAGQLGPLVAVLVAVLGHALSRRRK